jgi:hypothetical protein
VAHATSPLERANDVGDLLGAAGTLAGQYNDAHTDPYGDVDMFLSDQEYYKQKSCNVVGAHLIHL